MAHEVELMLMRMRGLHFVYCANGFLRPQNAVTKFCPTFFICLPENLPGRRDTAAKNEETNA